MHSRIFQISSKPVSEDNRIHESKYYEGFVGSVADYVDTMEDTSEELKWLQQATKGLDIDLDTKSIKVVSKEEYFEKKYEQFKEILDKLSYMTIEEFVADKYSMDFYELKSAYDQEHGFYADDNNEYAGLTTFDEWVRNSEEGETYFVGSVFDYHF